MKNAEINKSDEESTAFDKFIIVFRNGERNEVENVIVRLPSVQWAKGKTKMRRIHVGGVCAAPSGQFTTKKYTHRLASSRAFFFRIVIQDQSVLFAFIPRLYVCQSLANKNNNWINTHIPAGESKQMLTKN